MNATEEASKAVVDVLSIIPREQHTLIFNTFPAHRVRPGTSSGIAKFSEHEAN